MPDGEDSERPRSAILYAAMLAGVDTPLVVPRDDGKQRRFGANGMSFTLEQGALRPDAGLFEVASPECEGPDELIIHSLAMDALAMRALPVANLELRARGVEGQLRLVKGSRDVDGQVYGRQTNIAVDAPSGWRWPVFVACTLAFVFVHVVMVHAVFVVVFLGILLMVFGCMLFGCIALFLPPREETPLVPDVSPAMEWVCLLPLVLVGRLYTEVAGRLAFHRLSRGMEGWLISRSVVTGAGHVDADGKFWLSGKGQAVDRWMSGGLGLRPETRTRPVFATDSLLKPALLSGSRALNPLAYLDALRRMLGGTVRLQLGDEDSHRCPLAEGLSIAMVAHVVGLAEGGHLEDAPRFSDPLSAHRVFASDPTLQATVADTLGRAWTALELQAFYTRRAREHAPDDVWVREWLDVVETLGPDRTKWVGRLDWVTKAWLLEQVAEGASTTVRRRVDIEYHALGDGLYDRLMAVLDVPLPVDPADVERAVLEPPSGRACQRSDLIREHQERLVDVGWDRVHLPDRVIWL